MFSDPMVAVMAMLILCFSGILVMFIFVIRSLAGQRDEVRDAFRKQQMFLADLERQFLEMSFVLRKIQGGEEAVQDAGGTKKSSRDLPLLREDDDLMSMLESTSRAKNTKPAYDDLLLPPPARQRNAAEEYDPVTDPHLFEETFLPGNDSGYGQRTEPGTGRERGASRSVDPQELLLLRKDS